MLNVKNADVYTDINSLANLKSSARENSPEAIKQAAKQFESLFLNMIMKSMREAKLGDGIMDNEQSKFFQEMYDQQMALNLSGNPGVGLADLIAKQLSPQQQNTHGQRDLKDYFANSITSISNELKTMTILPEAKIAQPATSNAEGVQTFAVESRERSDIQALPLESQSTSAINSKQEFVEKLLPLAKQAATELGVDPKMLLAQAALETGWGNSVISNRDGSSSHNLFNIKAGSAWAGKQAKISTLEFEQGIPKKTMAGFRAYESYRESFNDYVKFLKENPRYNDALKQVGNPARYIRELQEAGYATDPQYANKVLSIYQGNQLTPDASEQLLALQQG